MNFTKKILHSKYVMVINMLVKDYFDITYGQREYHDKSKLESGKTILISSSSTMNGFYGFFDIEPKFTNVISLPSTGSIGESRVHDYPCCIDDNCLVLSPKSRMTKNQMYYVAAILRSQKWRFKYGRQITPKRIQNTPIDLINKVNQIWESPKIKVEKIKKVSDQS